MNENIKQSAFSKATGDEADKLIHELMFENKSAMSKLKKKKYFQFIKNQARWKKTKS